MTDPLIEEIYTLMVAAYEGGQPFVRVHAFPFHMTDENIDEKQQHPWYEFWLNLKGGYDFFANQKKPPNVEVLDGEYVFD